MKFDIYQSITDKIIEAIEAGAGDLMMPWLRGAAAGVPVNALTGKEYQGINVLNLWLTSQARHYTSNELDRDMGKRFGGESYAMEEQVAEFGSAFQCARLGLNTEPRQDHAQYISGWLSILKKDKKAIFAASEKAQEAATFLGGINE